MKSEEARAAAARDVSFYWTLAGILSGGVVIAIVLGLGDVWNGPGWFMLEDAIVSLFVMTLVMWLVLVIFLMRVRVFFDIEDRAEAIIQRENNRLAEAMARNEANWTQMKEALRQEFADYRNQLRRDVAERDGRISEALSMAGEAVRIARETEASRQVIQRTQNEMAPAIAVLQEQVAALQRETKATNVRLAETLDALERREMDAAAASQKLEADLASLRRREQLLLIKNKELEEVGNRNSRTLADRPTFVES